MSDSADDDDEDLAFCVDCGDFFNYDDCGGYNPPCECGMHCRHCHELETTHGSDDDTEDYDDDPR